MDKSIERTDPQNYDYGSAKRERQGFGNPAVYAAIYAVTWLIVAPIAFGALYFSQDSQHVIPASLLSLPREALESATFDCAVVVWVAVFATAQISLERLLYESNWKPLLAIDDDKLALLTSVILGAIQSGFAIPAGQMVFRAVSAINLAFPDIVASASLRFMTCGLAALIASVACGFVIGKSEEREERT